MGCDSPILPYTQFVGRQGAPILKLDPSRISDSYPFPFRHGFENLNVLSHLLHVTGILGTKIDNFRKNFFWFFRRVKQFGLG